MTLLHSPITKKIAGILIGAAYGLFIRYGLASPKVHPIMGTISMAFLYACPFSVGAIAVLWGAERGTPIPLRRQLGLSTSAMWLFLLAMFATFLEGLICIVLVVPVFLLASAVGGMVGGAGTTTHA